MPSLVPGGRMRLMESSPLIYVECDVPEGMTLTEWRRSQREGRVRKAPLWRRVLALA